MTLSSAQTAEFQAFAEKLAEAAADAIQPYFRAKLDVEDNGGVSSIRSPWPTRLLNEPCAN